MLLAVGLVIGACGSSGSDGNAIADEPDSVDDIEGDLDEDDDAASLDDGGAPEPVDVQALTSREWVMLFGGGPDGEVELIDGLSFTIRFGADGTLSGSSGACVGYTGSYELNIQQISIPDLELEGMECAPDVQASEDAFLAALIDSNGINLLGDELALSGPSSELIFAPSN